MIVRGEVSALMEKVLRLTETEERNKERNNSFQQRVFFAASLSDLFGCNIILNCECKWLNIAEVTTFCSEILENRVM
jgi:hypothetical protein